jgi:hypothetical protein
MRRFRAVVLAGAILATAVPIAHAITNGQPDDGAHPYVALVAFHDPDDGYVQRCSGTLIAKKVVLTVAHCGFSDDGTALPIARVWVDDVVGPGVISGCAGDPGNLCSGGRRGTVVPHPEFDFATYPSLPDTKDVALVLLERRIKGVGLARLAPIGRLDEIRKRAKRDDFFTLVGYGFSQVKPEVLGDDRTRRTTTARLGGLDGPNTAGFNLKTKPGSSGGTFCFGDSGGPVLIGDSRVVVAVSSLGKGNRCEKADLSYRVDTQAVQDWIAGVVVGAGGFDDSDVGE